jgi:methionyl-tRNA formyltransferase
MLLSNNNRSKAYLQNFIKEGLLPAEVIYMDKPGTKLAEQTENDSQLYFETNQTLIRECKVSGKSFDEKESVLATLKANNIPFQYIESLNPNETEVVKAVGNLAGDDCVYSGPGGIILRSELFSTGKNFIHAHPGKLPFYKGSTTIYYSLLINQSISVSVIELNKNLDEGDILHIEDFQFKPGSNLDYVVDPCVRACSLVNHFKNKGTRKKQDKIGDTFYIIHPILKHLSIIKNKAY